MAERFGTVYHIVSRYFVQYRIVSIVFLHGHIMPSLISYSVVMVAGICNSVGGGVSLTCHRGGGSGGGSGGEYGSMSRLGLLIGNRWTLQLPDCSSCSGMRGTGQ